MNIHTVTSLTVVQIVLFFVSFLPCQSLQCNLTHASFHVCLHVFLERDFPLIDEMMNKPNFIREGSEWKDMCNPVDEMISCYHEMMSECSVYFYLRERAKMVQIVSSLMEMRDIFCTEKGQGLSEIIQDLQCIESARRYGYCDANLTMQMNLFFKKLMRFQSDAGTSCQPLAEFKSCILQNAKLQHPPCDGKAMNYIERGLDAWLNNLCFRAGYYVSRSHPLTLPSTLAVLFASLGIVVFVARQVDHNSN